MGYVYYGNYATYFEVARTEMLRSLGFTYKEWEDKNKPLVSSSINASVPLGARVGAAVSSHSSKERGAHHLKLPKLPEPEVDK